MPKPSVTQITRLAKYAAIDQPQARETRTIKEAFTQDELGVIPVGTTDDVDVAFDRARKMGPQWARVDIKERAKIISRFADLVLANREFLIDTIQAESGKSRQYAQEEVLDVALTAQFYARKGPGYLAPKKIAGMLPVVTQTRTAYHPKGVVGIISPWNYPLTLAVSDAVAALLAGNAVVIKPDSNTPFSALAGAELLYQAGLPRELFQVVPGPGSVVGTAILEQCDYLMFTGSSKTGATLAKRCGERLIGFSAELGGKNPMIVTRDADLTKAADGAARACFSNTGQLCISIERIYVEAPVAEKFISKFAARTAALGIGPAYNFSCEVGSLASEDQLKVTAEHVDDARQKGATVVQGGKARPDLGALFYEPTILTGVTEEMTVYRTETFGPVVSVYPVADVAEAIRQANDTDYGLNSSVFAGSTKAARDIAAQLQTGTVNINEGYAAGWGSTGAPMGGFGISGVGRRHGPEGITKYCESQTVAAQHVIGIESMPLVPRKAYLKIMPHAIQALKHLPR